MKSITVHGYKDLSSRFSFVFTGVVLLVAMNMWIVVWIKNQTMSMWLLVFTVILAWMFWRMRRIFTKLRYTFSDTGITIHLPGGKEFFLDANQIDSTEQIAKGSWYGGWGIKYLFWKHEIHFTTASSHFLRIHMQDGRTVVISPKEYLDIDNL